MGVRDVAREAVTRALDFGSLRASSVTDTLKHLVATVRGIEGGEGADGEGTEERTLQEVWGHPALLWRPAAPTSDGACEVVFMRDGEEMIALAAREPRWQLVVDEGEVILRSMGSGSPATLSLKPDGSVVLEAATIKLGSASASDFVALASLVDDRLSTLQSAHDNHIHVTTATVGIGSAGTISPTASPVGPLSSVEASKTKAE